ncbi:uncharacterized protein EV422DRAFT_488610, partial [Fimicolochytrium jonesii]|uniref:uncharacterized protein n=1 Tax=Fimicolochytrium jonesii TaxID=1396493 RepID=UPI0022FEBF79
VLLGSGTLKFVKEVSKDYEISICTAGSSPYAAAVVKLLNECCGQEVIKGRMISCHFQHFLGEYVKLYPDCALAKEMGMRPPQKDILGVLPPYFVHLSCIPHPIILDDKTEVWPSSQLDHIWVRR